MCASSIAHALKSLIINSKTLRLSMKLTRQGLLLTILSILFLYPTAASAQVRDNTRRVDTLSLAERFSVRTNAVDWVVMVPNIGFEFDLGSTNYNRHAVNVNLRYRPESHGSQRHPYVFNLFEIAAEWRMYWSEQRAEPNGYLKRHTHWWDKLFSCRRMAPKHPNWVWYRGLFVSYADYNIYARRWDGRDGELVMAGITWGFVKPFVEFQNGNSIDMELGLSGGVGMYRHQKYVAADDFTGGQYNYMFQTVSTTKPQWKMIPFPVPRDLHIAVVYRFGNYPLRKKYRWRYDVDLAWREQVDSRWTSNYTAREQKFVRDSLYKVVSKDFRQLYDSVVAVRHKEQQESIDRRAPQRLTLDTNKKKK